MELSSLVDQHHSAINGIDLAVVEKIGNLLRGALRSGGKALCCGNGGSAAQAEHLVAELVGRFEKAPRQALAAMSLTCPSSVLTALANDFGYDHVFRRQIAALGSLEDVLVVFSTSGTSPICVEAVETALDFGIVTVGVLGPGGPLAELCDFAITVPSSNTARIQEAHLLICHLLCAIIENDHE